MARRYDAGERIFFRYIVNNVLILVLPMLMAALAARISFQAILKNLDATAASSLEAGVAEIDRLLAELPKMSIQIASDYEIGYYLNTAAPLSGVEFYNLKRVQAKLSSFVLGNGILGHCLLYMAKNGLIVYEDGFAAYDGFYGTLFTCDGYTADQWRDGILTAPGGEGFLPTLPIRMGGASGPAVEGAVYRRPIGYGDYFLGTVVGILDNGVLVRMLSQLPDRYGGRVEVRDAGGNAICGTGPKGASGTGGAEGPLRRYQVRSPLSGWTFTAYLSETKVLARARAVRDIAFLLLGIGLAAGVGASYLFAVASSRPLRRLFRLVLRGAEEPGEAPGGVYEQVERAIVRMADSNLRLESEALSAGRMTKAYFFQNLLRGSYPDREGFEEDRKAFCVAFRAAPYYTVVCRLAPLHAAAEGEPHALLRDALLEAAARRMGEGEHAIPVSFDDMALVKCVEEGRSFREQAAAFVDALRADLDPRIRGGFLFGIGTPRPDPFLLMVSHAEALTAAASAADGREAVRFYGDAPQGKASYFYPLAVEENLMKAVRSANPDLLDSLLATVREENFSARRLSALETRNLFVELQGTALRLIDGLPVDGASIRGGLARWGERPPSPEGLDGLAEILRGLMRAYDQGKKSHNAALLASLQAYIAQHYAEADLGLTRIADALGISENYLSNFHKEQTGERLSAAVQRIRFDEAVRLLLATDQGVDAVARRCGYDNTTSFRRAFKRLHGLSPSEFRMRAARIL